MNVNSLDARSFSARGGLGDGLANVMRAIAGGFLLNQDRADARQDRSAERDARLQEREQDQQRQDEERTWQHNRFDRQDARTGMSEALRRAAEYGIVPPRDEFVTRPSADEQATWAAAQTGAHKRGLAEALANAQIALTEHRGLAATLQAANGTGSRFDKPTAATLKAAHELAQAEAHRRGALTFDEVTGKQKITNPATWNTILRESYQLYGIDVPDAWRDRSDPSIVPPNGVPGAKRGMIDRILDQQLPGSGQRALPDADGPPPSEQLLADVRGMPAMPRSGPANAAATASGLAPAATPPAAQVPRQRMTMAAVLAENPWAQQMPADQVLRILANRGIEVELPAPAPIADASLGPALASMVR